PASVHKISRGIYRRSLLSWLAGPVSYYPRHGNLGVVASHPFAMRLRMDGAPRVLQLLSFRHGQRFALGCVVAVPLWNLHNIFAGFRNHGLTSQAGFQLLVGRHVHPVDLIVVRLADARLILDPQVASGAGAYTAARVIEKDVIVLSNVKK